MIVKLANTVTGSVGPGRPREMNAVHRGGGGDERLL